ncbi:hypothetical protein [Luteimonas sp. 100069]|uniref:hypothetical protein n=1 Tax=Luteimonas sp. 100069 TaxID=2006109 RepID=UPI000F4EF99D|nr:hypothetical protein [Luteimonas sp. 100069]RPD84010.1 hypothetical protein EGK76_12990 [Luteimonas sp. 100069]
MKTAFDLPFPSSWTADDLAAAVPRPLSASFDASLASASPPGRRAVVFGRAIRPTLGRDLPLLFRVR